MLTKEIIHQILPHLKACDERIEFYENEKIKSLLVWFKIPTEESPNRINIPMLLKQKEIRVLMPEQIFDSIDFSKLNIPKKLQFQKNRISNDFVILWSREDCEFNNCKLIFDNTSKP
jgi:hypothetical protein